MSCVMTIYDYDRVCVFMTYSYDNAPDFHVSNSQKKKKMKKTWKFAYVNPIRARAGRQKSSAEKQRWICAQNSFIYKERTNRFDYIMETFFLYTQVKTWHR